MNKILITGGAGFIGINAAKYFIEKGWHAIIFDDLSRELVDENLKWLKENHEDKFELIKADVVTDTKKLNDAVSQVDLVLHLAAQVAVTTSVNEPENDLKINIIGTFNVLEAIRKSNSQPPLIFSSTNKVYGGLEQFKIEEQDKRYEFKGIKGVNEKVNLDFHSPYGCSKGAADQYVRDYNRIYGLKTVVLRQSCIYGPHQFGVEDQGWVAWFTIATLLNKKITLFGNGKQVRDILYVDDLVRCYEMVYQQIDKTAGKIYNIGGGYDNSISLLEFMEVLEKNIDKKINYDFSDWRPGDQPIYISDNSLLESEIGWKAEVGKAEGIKKITDWLKGNIDILK